MKRSYATTWGAVPVDKGVRFRLWAPAAKTVSVCVTDSGERVLPMTRHEDGWFERVDADARAGSRYLFEIDGALRVADPASRFQPEGIERPSEVIDAENFEWPESTFEIAPYGNLNFYELHVGTFTPEGTYAAAQQRLEYLANLGVRAIEIMPLSQAAGLRNWGYDGVHHYAPAHQYGRPEDLKRFIAAAHDSGIAAILDVVYNHFGPQGNYLPKYAPQFFSAKLKTPWGAGIDYSSPGNDAVRRFTIENACYWLTEYGFDGLRLDAVPMIFDSRPKHVVAELLDEARRTAKRRTCFIAEDVENEVLDLAALFDGRWSDDVHHALHVALTGEHSEYFQAFTGAPMERLGGALTTEGAHRVSYLQNHDQIGNRPFGDRLSSLAPLQAVRAAAAAVLLAPGVPLIFMGEEWAASAPFLFFCDFEPNLAKRVREGRRAEFADLAGFDDPRIQAAIVDPTSLEAFERSKLRWEESAGGEHSALREFYRELFRIRREAVAPLLAEARLQGTYKIVGPRGIAVRWKFSNGTALSLSANFNAQPQTGFEEPSPGRVIFSTHEQPFTDGVMPAWSVCWILGE